MNDEVSMPDDIVAFANELANAEPGSLEVIKMHLFEDDESAHDDSRQEQIHQEFEDVFSTLVESLKSAFGDPQLSAAEDEFEEIPLCGVFPAASWELETGNLFLAVSHEDREAPNLLAIGLS